MLYPAVFIVLLLPWLNPFAPGPSAAVGPVLFSWACGLAFLGLWAARPSGARLVAVAALAWLAAGVLNSSFGVRLIWRAGACRWLIHLSRAVP